MNVWEIWEKHRNIIKNVMAIQKLWKGLKMEDMAI